MRALQSGTSGALSTVTLSIPISMIIKVLLVLHIVLQPCINKRSISEAFQLVEVHRKQVFTFSSYTLFPKCKLSNVRTTDELIRTEKKQFYSVGFDRNILIGTNNELESTIRGKLNPKFFAISEIMNAWAKTRTTEGAVMAEMWLQRVRTEVEMGNQLVKLDTDLYNTAIDAWANSGDEHSFFKAQKLTEEMKHMYKLGHNCQPTARTFNLLIYSWEKSGEASATRVEQILDDMKLVSYKPNINTYNLAIRALARKGAPERAEAILMQILDHNSNSDGHANVIVKPNSATFNHVIDAWAGSNHSEASSRAERILEKMEALCEAGNRDVSPNRDTYSAFIHVLIKTGMKGSVAKAEQTLAKMEKKYRAGEYSMRPSEVTYNIVINALANSRELDSAERAERVLRNMLENNETGGDTGIGVVKPNVISFTSVINAWAKSGRRGAASRAEKILTLLQEHYTAGNVDVKPDTQAYTAVIHACTSTKHDEEKNAALKIAFRVFKQMATSNGTCPNEYTYAILLSACSQLLPVEDQETRFTIAKALFEKCCEAGFVNDYVLKKLRKTVATTKQYIQLVGSFELRAVNLPKYWTRNVNDNGGKG